MYRNFIPELLFLFAATIAAIATDYTAASIVVGLVVPSAIYWLRYCIARELSDHEKDDKLTALLKSFFIVLENKADDSQLEYELSEAFLGTITSATETLNIATVRAKTILGQLKSLARGEFTIANTASIFQHNTECLEQLDKSETYRTTHMYKIHLGVLDEEGECTSQHAKLVKAHCKAAKNHGVIVTRLYVFDDYYEAIPEPYIEEMSQLADADVNVRIMKTKKYNNEASFADITIINNEILGIVLDRNIPINKCEYRVNTPNHSAMFENLTSEFDRLADAALTLDKLLEKREKKGFRPKSAGIFKKVKEKIGMK
jgi:hypothetical protein